MVSVEIDGWREAHDSLSDVFRGTTYTVIRYCIATAFRDGVAVRMSSFTGECCDALAHNWACGWFRFDETPNIEHVQWFPMLA